MDEAIEQLTAAVRSSRRGSDCSGSGSTASESSSAAPRRRPARQSARSPALRCATRSTSEYCLRSSKRIALMARSRRTSKGWLASPHPRRRQPGCVIKPARTAFRPRRRCRSRKCRHRAGRVRSIGPVRGAARTLAPDMKGFAELGQKPGTMMIYHRLMRESGHFQLLKLICCSQYLRYRALHKRHFVPLRMI